MLNEIFAELPIQSLGELQIAAIALVVFLAALLRGYAGFGSSLLMVPVFTLAVDPKLAVCIGLLLEGVATLMLVPAALRHADQRTVLSMGSASVLGIPLGQVALLSLDPTVTSLAISLLVTLMAAAAWRGEIFWLPRGPFTRVGVGATSGFLTGFGSVGGPPLVLYALSGSEEAVRKRADVIVIAGVTQAAAIVSMTLFGAFTLAGAASAIFLSPVFYVGGMVGVRLFSKSNERAYLRIAFAALFVSAVSLVIVNAARLLP